MTPFALGIDLGTSGVRSAVIARDGTVIADARYDYGGGDDDKRSPECWWRAVRECIERQLAVLGDAGLDPRSVERLGVDGTSGSILLVDDWISPVTRALMYSDGGFDAQADKIAKAAPAQHITKGPDSSLARALALQHEPGADRATQLLHQADFIIARLRGRVGASDENNCLKLGYDPETGTWPDWFPASGLRADLLPRVTPAGTRLGSVDAALARALGLSERVQIHSGTTDSLAAFLASARLETGSAVTSLGTTLAIKIVSDRRIDASEMGLYSHRLGGRWLVGGASNTGGGVLRSFFDAERLADLSERIDPDRASPLDYYPLTKPGERFPIRDPAMPPRLTPRPEDDAAFLHGILEGIARIEARCYDLIVEMGGPAPRVIRTAGGGASNPHWAAIRARVLGRPVKAARHTEAAIGAARLTMLVDDCTGVP